MTTVQPSLSILNDVIGPVMRGPSSSHTAASYQLGRLAAALLGARAHSVVVSFDPGGSYGQVYRQQGVDLGFAMGLLGLPLTDSTFFRALEAAAESGIDLRFQVKPLASPDHPNATDIQLQGTDGSRLQLRGRSIGGGAVEITQVEGWPVLITGQTHEVLIELAQDAAERVRALLAADASVLSEPEVRIRGGSALLHAKLKTARLPQALSAIQSLPELKRALQVPPVAYVKQGQPLFASAAQAIALAASRGCSLGRLALAHEAGLLGISEKDVSAEMMRRVELMFNAAREGLGDCRTRMQLLTPTAASIFRAEKEGRLPIGGLHTRAAARSMGVMQINSGRGVVCAAPTGGSAGVLPAVLLTLHEDRSFEKEALVFAALAAGAVGLVVGARATFAAEVAGCQVEIGAAGAMAAAAVVEAAGGTPQQAADAAAISFQNTMGTVCDLVQGIVEIPCHTRNAVAASSAFVCADLVLGGYINPIPLDETVDAVLAVGRMMPSELRVTSRGGLAVTPSALRLHQIK